MSASVRRLAAPFLEKHPCRHAVRLAFDGYRIDVLASEKPLADWLARYYRAFQALSGEASCQVLAVECPAQPLDLPFAPKTPEPGKARIKEEWAGLTDGRVVRKVLTGMLFLFGPGFNLALGPCADNPNQVVNFINSRFVDHKLGQGCLLGHAAAVSREGRGLALAGFSGMGKSTLALHLMNRGLDFVSNDRVLVCRENGRPRLYGLPKMPRVNPGTVLHNPSLARVMPESERAACLAMPEAQLWSLERKYDAFIDECFGPGRFRLEAGLAGLAILNWARGAGAPDVRQVDLAARRDLLPAFMKAPGLFHGSGQERPGPEAYLEELAGCPVLEVAGGADFEAAADRLTAWLEARP